MGWVIFIIILILVEIYAFQAFYTLYRFNLFSKIYVSVNLIVFTVLIYRCWNIYARQLSFSDLFYDYLSIPFALLFVLFSLKLIICFNLLIEDFFRVVKYLINNFNNEYSSSFQSRRNFISKIAILIGSVPIPFVLFGIFKGRYNFKIFRYEIESKNLPEEFDGYQLTHISDIHAGSLVNRKKIQYAVDLINKQNSDLVLFTGDFVNNKSEELTDWTNIFSNIKSKDGKFSILGNHDYGDYVSWKSEKDKEENFNLLLRFQNEMGFKVLMNENTRISRNNKHISIVGFENWGKGRFRKSADIRKACSGLDDEDFKIIMTHDPSHWDEKLKDYKTHFDLTLSGHTHGMQFGIEIPGFIKWSPVKWVYKHWAGLYHEDGQYLNVNRGFGVLAFPGRVGIWPEISVIKLRKV